MRTNYKFHATAIAIISVVISVLFFLFGPKASQNSAPVELTKDDSYVRIVGATWGENCNTFIESAMAVQAKQGLKKDEKGNVIPSPVLKKVMADNVLDNVKSMCDRKLKCESYINSESLGNDPHAECFKRLHVTYRCFEVDRLQTLDIGQGETLSIDCSNPTASNAPTNGQ